MRIEKQEKDRMVLVNRNSTPVIVGIFLIFAGFLILKDLIFNGAEGSSFWTLLTIPIGVIFILYRKITAVILNKKIGKIFIIEKRTFGRKKRRRIEMDSIREVFLLIERSDHIGDKDSYNSTFSFIAENNESIPFFITGKGITRVTSKKIEKQRTLAPQIASFLDVSYRESVPIIRKKTKRRRFAFLPKK